MRPALLIHGPTASGKTQISLELAKRLGGEIVNADSMQVYRDLSVLTARPTDEEMKEAPHHLFGYKDAAERGSAGSWLRDARPIILDIQKRGNVPIIIGGTGLHLMALVDGLSEIPPIPEDSRQEVRKLFQQEGPLGAHRMLAETDPESAERLAPNDRQRVARALEVWYATGKTLSSYHENKTPPVLTKGEWLGIALTPPRQKLYGRIDSRFASMLIEGAMDEARALAARDLDPNLPAMKAHGMPWLLAYLRGEMKAELAAEYAKRDTRRYAKRQFTWIAHQFPFWPRIPSTEVDDRKRVIHALFKEIDAAYSNR
ncbi:tRNA (adenosine(37)-N6)-dimethylallyltransferase MiaA [Ponticaulis profundi]|uniref:tRNA dimethylallyltransferase n=1 Tax=Ponticaulis profundi TaxID=2665222 RepID=A0ABW1SES1_9PROT